MSLTIEQIKAEAIKLPPEVRADLADWLWVSVESRESVQAAWDAEIARRIEEIESGAVALIPGEEVLAAIDKKLRDAGA